MGILVLREETGVRAPMHLAQFGAFGDPGRDPRTNVVTVGYYAVVPDIVDVVAGSDAIDAEVWPVKRALHASPKLAFDHRKILKAAVDRAAAGLEGTDLATAFVGPTFTLTELQSVYEAMRGDELDAANFRRRLTSDTQESFVEPTGERTASSPRGGRPPELYRAGEAWKSGSPLRRSRKRKKPT